MKTLISKGRASEMLSVFDYFIDLVKEEKKIGKADVVTAVELSAEQKAKVEKKLLEQYSNIADELNGTAAIRQESEELKALRAEVAEYRDVMKEFIALRKSENNK